MSVAAGSWRDIRIEVGPELEVGWARVGGEPRVATTAALGGATWGSIGSVVATARLRLTGRVWVTADLRVGAVVKGVTLVADEREAAAVSGGAGSARLGVAIELLGRRSSR